MLDQTVQQFALDAAGTTDPNYDVADLDFAWSVEDGAGELDGSAGTVATYAPAHADRGQTLTFTVEVTNPDGASDTATMEVTLEAVDAEPPTAVIEYLHDSDADSVDVEVGDGPVELTGFATTDPAYDLADLDFEWSTDGAGDLLTDSPYAEDWFAAYDPSPQDAGETVTVTLTVTNPAGEQHETTFAVHVAAPDDGVEPPNASIVWADDPDVTEPSVNASVDSFDLSALYSTDPEYGLEDLLVSWDVDANGTLSSTDDWNTTYEIAEDDRGEVLEFVATVTNPDGASDTATFAVALDAAEEDEADDEDETEEDDSGGVSIGAPPSGGTGDDDTAPAPSEFTFSLDSSADPIVLLGEHAEAGSSAGLDLGVALGLLDLDAFEAEAAVDAQSFEVTIGTSDRAGPDVDGDLLQTIELDHGNVLGWSELALAVNEGALDDGTSVEDLEIYTFSDGEWHQTDVDAAAGTTAVDFEDVDALAVLDTAADEETADEPEPTDDSGLGFGTIAIVLVIGVVVAVLGVEYFRRQE